jgi:hypothetical protein
MTGEVQVIRVVRKATYGVANISIL